MAGPSGSTDKERLREVLEGNFWLFLKYINPHYVYGDIHEEVAMWFQEDGPHLHQLLLMPRAHLKSHEVAAWCVWMITKDPCTTIVYLSAGEDLAEVQMAAIKGMLTCDRYRKLWPEMVSREEAKRSKWSSDKISVDHPLRKERNIRDHTLVIKTVKSNFTGLHCDIMVYDDVVVPNNAYTEAGRRDVKAAVAQCGSIKNPGAITKAVGTRYHPSDIYGDFKAAVVRDWCEELGDFKDEAPLWDIKEFVVEDFGDMTGRFLWPREENPTDGKSYGFNTKILAGIQAQYFSLGENAQFYAQYYNNCNDPSSEKVSRDSVQFYDEKYIRFNDGNFYFKDKKLNIYAAMDVAWTVKKGSDYTAIGVIGVDSDWNIFVLALDRFKTQDYDVYYKRVENLHSQWGFRKLFIETNAGGSLVAQEIKARLRRNGSILQIEGKAATGNEGKKEEKHNAVLIPRVKNGQLFLTKGGLSSVAIEEIVLERPPNDDLKDVLTLAISNAQAPSRTSDVSQVTSSPKKYHSRFGGRVA